MKQITINVCGKEYPAVFNLGTMAAYERITGKSFFQEDFAMTNERMVLILSAVIAADENTDLTFDALKDECSFADMAKAFKDVSELSTQFFEIPEVVKQSEDAETPKDDKPKKGRKAKN